MINLNGHLRHYSNEITAIPEGNDYDLFGWAKPMFEKFSVSRALTFSWLFPNKKYDLNTNTNGEHRAFVVTGSFEEVFPLDIYPMQILTKKLILSFARPWLLKTGFKVLNKIITPRF